MQRVAAHDSDALMALYEQYSRIVYSVAIYVLQDPQHAEEITQDVFMTVWQKAAMFDMERGTAKSWLTQIARNLAIDHLRRQRRRGAESHPLELAEVLPAPGTIHNDDQHELFGHLQKLPAEQRQAIEMAYFQGYTHQEIAERLKLPLGTVKSRILLGLRKLQALLK